METKGINYGDIRQEKTETLVIRVENEKVNTVQAVTTIGTGVRVLVDGAIGFSATRSLDKALVKKAVDSAVKLAKAGGEMVHKFGLAEVEQSSVNEKVPFKEDPRDISIEEKVNLTLRGNEAARKVGEEIKSTVTVYMERIGKMDVGTTHGALASQEATATGFAAIVTAKQMGEMEQSYDSWSKWKGYELISELNEEEFAEGVAKHTKKVLESKHPPSGTLPVVAGPREIGLILHEAFGHGVEGDIVLANQSVLGDNLGKRIATDQVTIIDGPIENEGVPCSIDEEGTKKNSTTVVENGILKSFLTSRTVANALDQQATANAKAQNTFFPPLVRQTNFYMKPGQSSFDELLEDIKEGLYVIGTGARGGQVDTAGGTFSFGSGKAYLIRDGEVKDLVKSTTIAGDMMTALKKVSAVGSDFKIRSGIFGGCGKGGQSRYVGHGGPTVRFNELTVGGQ